MKDINEIMAYLDSWVKEHGRYVSPHEVPDTASNSMKLGHILKAHQLGIQQVREEIKGLVSVVLEKGLNHRILEIGLGYYGGTHMLWRQIFDEVVTIEYSRPVIWKFRLREHVNGRSKVILGNSHEFTMQQRIWRTGMFDMLFIDGDHTYDGIMQDYRAYHYMVREGGLIAIHDSICKIRGFGIRDFLYDLEFGFIDKKLHKINQINYSDHVGIAYIER